MESSLVIELKVTCVDTGYFVGIAPAKTLKFNLGKSRDEFTSKLNQGM
jgi:hypothetical protein